jgi:uncharacterized protein YaiL (DUF2058 family)
MLKTYLYIPDELDKKVTRITKAKKISKAEFTRDAIKEKVERVERSENYSSADIFLKLAEMGKKYNLKGPKDLSKNHNKYLWDTYEV